MLRCTCHPHPLLCIIPPYMLDNLSTSSDAAVRKLAVEAIAASAEARAVRGLLQTMPQMAALTSPAAKKNRLIYDAKTLGQNKLPGKLVRSEGDKAVADPAVNEAYDYSGVTYDFYLKRFARNSLDGRGMTLVSSVHLSKKLNNAFWNGQQMAYGDGDGQLFIRFTKSLDVVGHELTHGVVSHECNLEYQDESGALNEHFADVFGMLIRQWKTKQTAAKSDWLIGKDIMGPGTKAKALRDFGPGKAYENDPNLGTDPQPKNLKDKFVGSWDNGGVHLNSGIPNHAFYLFAKAVGGNAFDEPAAIWYETMRKLSSNSQFADMVSTTQMVATKNHGAGSKQLKALNDAWKAVGF
nr:M4 family metallopeptidase [uncultured Roseateles sp.]